MTPSEAFHAIPGPDAERAMAYLVALAEEGDGEAMEYLGVLHSTGRACTRAWTSSTQSGCSQSRPPWGAVRRAISSLPSTPEAGRGLGQIVERRRFFGHEAWR
jgi:CRISPR/Cas system-associated endonuclease Cas3-HD